MIFFVFFMVLPDQVFRATAPLLRSTAFASKIDATGETPRSLAKTFSRVRVYAAAVRYDINSFWCGLPDVSGYSTMFSRMRPPFYTARARVSYPPAKRHLWSNYFLPYALYGWGLLEPVTFVSARAKRRKYGLTVTGRAYGAPRFSFHYIRNYLYVRRLRKQSAGKRRFGQRYRRRYRPLYYHMPRRLLARLQWLVPSLRLRIWRARGLSAAPVIWSTMRRRFRFNFLTFSTLARVGRRRAFSRRRYSALCSTWPVALGLQLLRSTTLLRFLRFCHWQAGFHPRVDVSVSAIDSCGPNPICASWRGLLFAVFGPSCCAQTFSALWLYHFFPMLSRTLHFYGRGLWSTSLPWHSDSDAGLWAANLAVLHASVWVPTSRRVTFSFRASRLPRADLPPIVLEPDAVELRLSVIEAFLERFTRRLGRRLQRASSLLPIALAFRSTLPGSAARSAFFNFALYPIIYRHQTLGRFYGGGARYKYRALRTRLFFA